MRTASYKAMFFYVPIIIFTIFLLSLNSENAGVLSSNFIDSGSMFFDFQNMSSFPIDLDHQRHWHTGFYGGVFNQIQIFMMLITKLIFGPDLPFKFLILVSRSISALFTILSISMFLKILAELKISQRFRLLGILSLFTMPGFIKFSYEIHPESTGLFFALIGVLYFIRVCNYGLNKTYFGYILISSVLATLIKASFAPFLILPIVVWWQNRDSKLDFLSYKKIIFIIILVVFISNPYILLNPLEWIKRQVSIQIYYSNINLSFFDSTKLWVNVIESQLVILPMTMVYFILGFKNANIKSSGFKKIISVFLAICFLELFLNVAVVRFIFQSHYFYPVYPILIIITILFVSKCNFKRLTSTFMLLVFICTIFVNGIISFSQLLKDYNFNSTIQARAGQFVNSIEGIDSKTIVYSASLPFEFNGDSRINSFQFESNLKDISAKLKLDEPNYVVIDQTCGYCNPKEFLSASEKLGYSTLEVIQGVSVFDYGCTIGGNVSLTNCIKQIGDVLKSKTLKYKKLGIIILKSSN